MTKSITMDEVLELVEFRYNPLTQSWRVSNVKGNSSMDVIGDCWSVGGFVHYTINDRRWQYVETPKQKLKRLIEETKNSELILLYNELELS